MIDTERWNKFANDAKALLETNQKETDNIMAKHLSEVESEEDRRFLTETHAKIQTAMKNKDVNVLNGLMAELQNKIKA